MFETAYCKTADKSDAKNIITICDEKMSDPASIPSIAFPAMMGIASEIHT